jgi:hypothetical protein
LIDSLRQQQLGHPTATILQAVRVSTGPDPDSPAAKAEEPAAREREAPALPPHLLTRAHPAVMQASMRALQRTVGNRAVRRLLQRPGQRGQSGAGPVLQRHVPTHARMAKELADGLLADSHRRMGSVHALISAGQPERAQEFVTDAHSFSQLAEVHYEMGFQSAENHPTTQTEGAAGTAAGHEAVHTHEESHAPPATPAGETELEEG